MLADLLSLAGSQSFRIFDTDFPAGDLAGFFPENSQIVDFSKTAGQIQVFDTILSEPQFDYVIDLDQALLGPFFKIFSDIRFDQAAKDQGISVSIYFMLDRKVSTISAALDIQRLARKCAFVPIRNEAIGNILTVPLAARIYGEIEKTREIILPRLSIDALNHIDRLEFTFADFLSRNGENAPPSIRFEIWNFLESLYNQRTVAENATPTSL